MAQIDTGMGWEAKDTYLINTASLIGKYTVATNPDFVNQPLPNGTWINDMSPKLIGIKVAENNLYDFYAMVDGEGTGFICGTPSPALALSPNYNTTVRLSAYSKSTGAYYHGTTIHTTTMETQSGMYYKSYSTGWLSGTVWDVSYSSGSVAPIAAGFTITSSDMYKLNPGYAVGCFARYTNLDGDSVKTPVLISTDFSATLLSDGVSPIATVTYTYLHDGLRFYMTMIPSSRVDPDNASLVFADLTNFPVLVPEGVFNALASTDWANILVTESHDPYVAPPSGPGGADPGTVTDDRVGIIHNPFIPSALGTGLVRAFCPTENDLATLRNWLWDAPGQGGLDLDDLKRVFVDPADNIVGLSVVPISITGPSVNFSFGGVVPLFTLPQLQHQYYQVQCGYINVEKRWGSYLDYEPYTEFYIYLPFIGMKPISADEIMGKQLIVDYDIDVISGACLARVQAGQHLLYSWSGQCAMQIPINARNWDSVFATAIQCATQVATGIATGGSSLLGGAAAASVNALTTKARFQHSGVLSSAPGWMGNLTPYIVRVNPVLAIPEDQNKFIGYPSWTSVNLGELTGFNIISSIHLEGVPATDNELTEIEEILKEGVIF